VLVYGDTNSTLAGALAAAKLNIPVAHVEAGLRSFVRTMPEEINRVVADHVSEILFPPTAGAHARLLAEGLGDRRILPVGDVMYDAVLHARSLAASRVTRLLPAGLPESGYILATIHRAENADSPARLGSILEALAAVAGEHPIVLPLHPRTRAAASNSRSAESLKAAGLCVIEPVGYLAMQQLEAGARLIVTDSGGVQKEAYWHGVPCVTVRSETEWTELVDAGWNQLVPPTSAEAVERGVRDALARGRGPRPDLYGDGAAGDRIAAELAWFLEQQGSS
jgi:UDP-GlcNAc3NAcA epimerase